MWWRLSIFGLAALMLAGCGFSPIYAKHEAASSPILASISIEAPKGLEGSLLKTELENHLNPESVLTGADYRLIVGLESRADPFIFETDGTASRYNITFTSPFSLIRIIDGKEVLSGKARRNVSYNISEKDDYAAFVTRQDAYRRGIIEIAQDIRFRVAAVLR